MLVHSKTYEENAKDLQEIKQTKKRKQARFNKCSTCVWATKIDIDKIYCMYPECVLDK
jgi:hypothetical protein